MKSLIIHNKGILFLICIALAAFALLTYLVIKPAYLDKNNGMYGSKLGYPSLVRATGGKLTVTTNKPKQRQITRYLLGEGVCSSKPILVPIIPMAMVQDVVVEEGSQIKAGDTLATLENQKAMIKYESAKLAVSTAAAELERVKLGSAYVLAQERPEVEKINLASILEQQEFAKQALARYEKAYQKGVISKVAFLEAQKEATMMTEQVSRAELSMKMAESGVLQSIKIAENSHNDALQALAHREQELEAYNIHSPVEGVVDRVLINTGEYNQDSGKPGFLISSGLWFDAYFDQADFQHISTGLEATVSLESYPGSQFTATTTMIKPVISFNSGGPEISRPLRPRGSGSPEWAATFKVKLEFTDPIEARENKNQSIVTGMTGFARLKVTKTALTVPRNAVLSISAGSGILYIANDDDTWALEEVRIGHVDDKYVEILSLIDPEADVIIEGHRSLQPDDQIKVHRP